MGTDELNDVGNTAIDWHPNQGGVERLPTAFQSFD